MIFQCIEIVCLSLPLVGRDQKLGFASPPGSMASPCHPSSKAHGCCLELTAQGLCSRCFFEIFDVFVHFLFKIPRACETRLGDIPHSLHGKRHSSWSIKLLEPIYKSCPAAGQLVFQTLQTKRILIGYRLTKYARVTLRQRDPPLPN